MTAVIRLRDLMDSDDGWGHEMGRCVHQALLKELEKYPFEGIVRISLKGVHRTDASFPMESVIELAFRLRGQRGVCLIDVTDPDLVENWDGAAAKRRQPILCWNGDDWRLLGPEPSKGKKPVFLEVMNAGSITAKSAAQKLDLSVTNASTKLQRLVEEGYLLRREEVAPSGGREYVYFRIR